MCIPSKTPARFFEEGHELVEGDEQPDKIKKHGNRTIDKIYL